MLEVKRVFKSYGEKAVLQDCSLSVGGGSVFGLVGINGAGKSTLLRILAGVMRADDGETLFDGEGVFENRAVKEKIFFLSASAKKQKPAARENY